MNFLVNRHKLFYLIFSFLGFYFLFVSLSFAKCAGFEDYLNHNFHELESCGNTELIKKINATSYILTNSKENIGRRIGHISKYDEGTGIWKLMVFKRIVESNGESPIESMRELSQAEIESTLLIYDTILSEHDFKYEEKRVFHSLLKHAMFSKAFESSLKKYLKPFYKKNTKKDSKMNFFLNGDRDLIMSKLACFAMIDVDDITIDEVINSLYFKRCVKVVFLK